MNLTARIAEPATVLEVHPDEAVRGWQHVNDTLEQDIKRIAHALHDESGQLLVSVHLQLAQLARSQPLVSAQLNACQKLLGQVERQLRNLSHELHPLLLDDLGWLPAIEFLAASVAARGHVPVEVRSSLKARLPPPVEIALYRVVQEGLANAARHAHASRIRVEIVRSRDCLQGVIADDGVGFDVAECLRRGGLGLQGMRARLAALGGSLQLLSVPGHGAELRFQVPLSW